MVVFLFSDGWILFIEICKVQEYIMFMYLYLNFYMFVLLVFEWFLLFLCLFKYFEIFINSVVLIMMLVFWFELEGQYYDQNDIVNEDFGMFGWVQKQQELFKS